MILITGATGLLGSRLLFDLLTKGKKVRCMKRAESNMQVINKQFADDQSLLQYIDWVEADICDIFSIENALKDIDQVYHCAGYVSFSPGDYGKMMQVNSNGTSNLVNCCLEAGIKKLCHVSSVAAIGRSLNGEQITEETLWQSSGLNSNYAISKYGAEREVWRGIAEGLEAVIVNPTVILGRGNWKTGSSSMIRKVYEGLKFYTTGINGFVDVGDVSQAMIKLMESTVTNERFILNSENIMYKDFFLMAAKYLNKPGPVYHAGPVLSEIAWRVEWFRRLFIDGNSLITRETARTANNRYYYSSEKIRQRLGITFMPVSKSIEHVCKEFLEEQMESDGK